MAESHKGEAGRRGEAGGWLPARRTGERIINESGVTMPAGVQGQPRRRRRRRRTVESDRLMQRAAGRPTEEGEGAGGAAAGGGGARRVQLILLFDL